MRTARPTLLVFAFIVTGVVAGADWPTWRADASRTGASHNPLPDGLSLLWHKDMGYPSGYLVERGETYVRYPPRDRIVARDMAKPRWRLLVNSHQVVRRLEFPIKWELKTPHKVLIASTDGRFRSSRAIRRG